MLHFVPIPAERRELSWSDYGAQINFQFYSQTWNNLQPWHGKLKKLLVQLKHPDFV